MNVKENISYDKRMLITKGLRLVNSLSRSKISHLQNH